MRGRNESAVLHETRYDLSRTHAWLRRWNETHARKATLFHLILFAVARALHERPGLNRFVSGCRIYQRNGVFLSFAVKAAFADDAPIVTIKLAFPADDTFQACAARVAGAVGGARGPTEGKKRSSVDQELAQAQAEAAQRLEEAQKKAAAERAAEERKLQAQLTELQDQLNKASSEAERAQIRAKMAVASAAKSRPAPSRSEEHSSKPKSSKPAIKDTNDPLGGLGL
jgi:hypothetical protein